MYLGPNPVLQFFDSNGAPLVGGQLFVYQAGTTDKQAPFTDSTGNTALPDPIVLNARGEVAPSATGTSCGLWLDPTLAYKFVLAPATDTDPPTNPFWTVDNVTSAQSAVLAALAQYEATIGGVPIGAQMAYAGPTAPNGWLLEYGQAISRSTYALLFAIIGTAYGVGDGTTTFNLPDKRGRVSVGVDNMGGSAANRITNAVCGITGTTQGAAGGDQNTQLHTHTVTDPQHNHALTDPGHLHGFQTQGNGGGASDGIPTSIAGGSAPEGDTYTATTGVSIASAATGITLANFGTGESQNVQPSQMDNWIIFTGVNS
jgi:microcystin-dependent protein